MFSLYKNVFQVQCCFLWMHLAIYLLNKHANLDVGQMLIPLGAKGTTTKKAYSDGENSLRPQLLVLMRVSGSFF